MDSVPFLQMSEHAHHQTRNEQCHVYFAIVRGLKTNRPTKIPHTYSSLFSLLFLGKKKINHIVVPVLANYPESNLIKPKYFLQHPQDKYFSKYKLEHLSYYDR